MKLLSTLRDLFTRSPKLRNKPGGCAWIVGMSGSDAQLNGRAVKTVSFADGIWRIDPAQHVIYQTWTRGLGGTVNPPGRHQVIGLLDANLEPWRDIGDDEKDQSLAYLPPVPAVKVPHKEHA